MISTRWLWRTWFVFVLVVCVLGCDGRGTSTDGGGGGSAGGGMTGGGSAGGGASSADGGLFVSLTGELTDSIALNGVSATAQRALDAGTVALTPRAGQPLVLNAIFTFPGAPRTGPLGDDVRCGLTVGDTRTNKTWSATHAISGSADAGTCLLELTEVTVRSDNGTTVTFDVHGSISGVLEPLAPSASSSPLTLRADF